MSLTPALRKCIEVIDALTKDGVSPSYSEIQKACGLSSKNGVWHMINELEERGYIVRLRRRSRSIELTRKALQVLKRSNEAPQNLSEMTTAELANLSIRVTTLLSERLVAWEELSQSGVICGTISEQPSLGIGPVKA